MRRAVGLVFISILFGLAGAMGVEAQTLSFNVAPAYAAEVASPTGVRSVAIGDFTQDGIPDLVAGCYQNTASGLLFGVYLLPGTGGGVFGTAVGFPVSDGTTHAVASGDFNGDGLLDLATADYSAQTVSVLLATGPGAFAAPVSYAVGTSPKAVAVADFNADGLADLAVVAGGTGDGRVAVLLGTGSGAFGAPVSYAVGGTPTGVVVADFNGDGIPDLATANNWTKTASVLLGSGTGTFAAAVGYPMGGSDGGPTGLAAADFNADGFVDLAVSNQQLASPKRGYVALFLGTGTGTFQTAVKYDIGYNSNSRGVVAADFNADGVPDLAVVTQDKNSVTILLATGTGAFLPPYAFGVRSMVSSAGPGLGIKYLAVGDLNADGILDLAVTGPREGNVAVLLGTGTGKFAAASSYDAGLSPSSVVVRDFNGDGLADMAVSNLVSNDVSVLLGIGNGAFGPAVNYAAGYFPSCVATGDFNGDGILDLAAANQVSEDVSILLGTGTGSFGTAVNYPAGVGPGFLVVGDFNGDGFADLAAALYDNGSGASVSILLGTGTGAFGLPAYYATGAGPSSLALGDFNADGFADLATTNSYGASVSVLFGTGTGTFGAAVNYPVSSYPSSLALGDFNGDGLPDLAVAGGTTLSSYVSVLLGTGAGAFATPVNYASGLNPTSVAVADFDGDGFGDLVVANNLDSATSSYPLTDSVWVFPGVGDGTFSAPLYWTVGRRARALAVADLNGDTRPDVVAAGGEKLTTSPAFYWGYDVRILLNTTGTSCPAITLSPGSLPGGTQGAAYSQTITASGSTAPYTYTVTAGALPAGLNLASNGTLSGTPAAAGTSNFTVTATDALACTGSKAYALVIVGVGTADLSITKLASPDPVLTGGTLTYTLTVSNAGPDASGTLTVVDTLPSGVSYVSATGTGWSCVQSTGTVTCTPHHAGRRRARHRHHRDGHGDHRHVDEHRRGVVVHRRPEPGEQHGHDGRDRHPADRPRRDDDRQPRRDRAWIDVHALGDRHQPRPVGRHRRHPDPHAAGRHGHRDDHPGRLRCRRCHRDVHRRLAGQGRSFRGQRRPGRGRIRHVHHDRGGLGSRNRPDPGERHGLRDDGRSARSSRPRAR